MAFSWEDLLEEPDDLSDCDPQTRTNVSAVPDVAVVLVSPSSLVTECLGDVSLDSDREFVEPQSSSFSEKRAFVWTVSKEEMRYESLPVKALLPSSRRMMPHVRSSVLDRACRFTRTARRIERAQPCIRSWFIHASQMKRDGSEVLSHPKPARTVLGRLSQLKTQPDPPAPHPRLRLTPLLLRLLMPRPLQHFGTGPGILLGGWVLH